MTEWNKIAAAILACEASRQQQEMVKSGPGKTPETRDVAGELWSRGCDKAWRLTGRAQPPSA